MEVPVPSLNLNSSSSAESGNYGDVFFAPVNISEEIDWVDKIALPVTASVISGVIIYVLLKTKRG